MNACRPHSRRRGSIVVLTAVMMILMVAMLAFAVDIGYVALIRTQLQSSADSTAMAATWDLLANYTTAPISDPTTTLEQARSTADCFGHVNLVGGVGPTLTTDDVTFGHVDPIAGRDAPMDFHDPAGFNATRIRVRRQTDSNGEVGMFFARALGVVTCPSQAEATAAFFDNFSGFRSPSGRPGNINILPFAVDKPSWDALMAGNGADLWTCDERTDQVASGADGVRELNLYPRGTGSPGNRGTVDIGSNNNSTADISRQIREGISPADLAQMGGRLQLGPDGTLQLNGDTGISAGVKDDLASIIGQPRIIPIFSDVASPGNNAQYTIVGFAGVRIVAVDLTGKVTSRQVLIQPTRVQVSGGIPASDGVQHTYLLHSPVFLVR
jgi:hypothetical protein